MNTDTGTDARTGPFYGWWIVLAGSVVVAYGLGTQDYVQTLLPPLVRDEFRGGPELLGMAMSVLGLAVGPALLVAGPLIDRFGSRILMLASIPVACAGLLVLSIANTPTMLFTSTALIGIGLSSGFLLPVQTATANWFKRRRSLALAIVSSAAILGVPMVMFVGERIADLAARQGASVALGLGMLAICLPLALFIRHRPEQYGYSPDDITEANEGSALAGEHEDSPKEVDLTLWEALRTRTFWLLSVALAFATLVGTTATMYIVPILTDQGFTVETAIAITDAKPLMELAGILVFGYLGDLYSKRHLLAIAIAIQGAAVFILVTSGSIAQVYVFLLVLGLGSGTVPLALAIRADYFGRRSFATITVAMVIISGIGGMLLAALAVAFGNWLHETQGSLEPLFLLSVLAGIIAAALFLLSKPPQQPRASSSPANSGGVHLRG